MSAGQQRPTRRERHRCLVKATEGRSVFQPKCDQGMTMEHENRTATDGRERNSSKSDELPFDQDGNGEPDSDTSTPDSRPTPSGVPNEGRGMVEGQGRQDQSAEPRRDAYRGGQQGQGGVPNPDDVDDPSPGSFRGPGSQRTDTDETDDGSVDESDDGPQEVAVDHN